MTLAADLSAPDPASASRQPSATVFTDPGAPGRALWQVAALSLAFWLVFAAAAVVDDRVFNGVNVWIKPQKFALSLTVHFATLAWALSLLSPEWRRGLFLTGFVAVGVVCGVGEIVYIAVQAAKGEASHFNATTPFHALAYSLMGIGAVLLVALSFEVGRRVALDREAPMGPGLRFGFALGLMAGSVATLIFGGYLGSQTSHHVGAQLSDAQGLPFVGWATQTGDLRPAHFFATHLMQAMPVAGLLVDRARLPRPRLWVLLVGIAWTGFAVWAFTQALAGRPLLAI